MADLPTVFVSNWTSYKRPGMHGPGRKLTIMAKPRAWEHGEGRVLALVPRLSDLLAVQAGTLSTAQYRAAFLEHVRHNPFGPGALSFVPTTGAATLVQSGDTLCCACSRDAAAEGKCHRVWSAQLLVEAGWRVILDGIEILSAAEQYRREQESA